ncbi:MAG: potassium channel protein [Lewinellaceae bacterium]|nr:potassium channel protein [Lewinellaceae bacterium]
MDPKAPRLHSFHWSRFPGILLNLRVALLLLFLDISLGVIGFMYFEGYSLSDAFYMVVITISTVGYTEVEPLDWAGKMFVSVYILFNVGMIAYLLSVFSYYIIQGEIFKKMYLNLINTGIDKLENHVIICGYGRYGREIVTHFTKHQIPFVIIDSNPEVIEQLEKSDGKLLFVEEDATHDEALVRAGIKRAQALISALPDDSDNVFVVLTANQLNPNISIISRAKDPRSQKKLLLAGADHVVMPEQIGGFYMATLVTKPGAVDFFSFITNEYRSDIGFEELLFEEVPGVCRYKSIQDLHIRRETGANIIGFRDAEGHYHVNPRPDIQLTPGTSFIVLGDRQQLARLRYYIANYGGDA